MDYNHRYLGVMQTIRGRFDLIDAIKQADGDAFLIAEMSAFHGRKIVEGIAFGCLVALENGFGQVPRDARGQYNAESILKALEKKNLGTAFPSPSIIRKATLDETKEYDVAITVDGQPDKRMSREELILTYQNLHRWNHELNPYVEEGRQQFIAKHGQGLWSDLDRIRNLVDKHTISIQGEMFFCVLYDNSDKQTKVISLSKIASIVD